MKRIGLISDTHGHLDEKVFKHFNDCDMIWHAGDIGTVEISEELSNFKPFQAVWGNIDDKELRSRHQEVLRIEVEGFKILIIHIASTPPKYTRQVREIIKLETPQILICGHSHILRVITDKENNNMLYINPGAAGRQGFHKIRTIMKFDLNEGKIENMKVIELGKRG